MYLLGFHKFVRIDAVLISLSTLNMPFQFIFHPEQIILLLKCNCYVCMCVYSSGVALLSSLLVTVDVQLE